LQSTVTTLESDLAIARHTIQTFKIEEFTQKIKKLEEDKLELQTVIKHNETRRLQEEHLKSRIEQDCKDLVRQNVELRSQLDTVKSKLAKEEASQNGEGNNEHKTKDPKAEEKRLRLEISRVQDDFQMMKISMDMKDKQFTEISQQVCSRNLTP
jgi:hypothetical protein